MSGCVHDADADTSKIELLAIAKVVMRERGLVLLSFVVGGDAVPCAGGLREFHCAGGVVGMNMRFEHVRDLELARGREIEIDIHIAAGIDDGNFALLLAANSIGVMG